MDRCRVWESHADPSARRLTKPSPDPIYPAYAVGDDDYNIGTTRVAEVTGHKSKPHQLGGHAPAGAKDCGAAGSEAGGTRGRETVTAGGEGDTVSRPQS